MAVISHLFPKARAEVLRLLLGSPGSELHVRDLARLAGLSPAGLQRELANLSESGLVLSRRDGNRLYFRANTAHPVFPELHGLILKTTGVAGEIQRALSPVEGIEMAFIFGSIASGLDSADSDIDVLVLGAAGLRAIAQALREVASTVAREINPYCLTPAEWTAKLRRGDAFILRVAEEPKLWLKGDADELGKLG